MLPQIVDSLHGVFSCPQVRIMVALPLIRSVPCFCITFTELSFTASDMGETWEDDAETESFMDASEDSEEEQQRIQDSSQDSGIQVCAPRSFEMTR